MEQVDTKADRPLGSARFLDKKAPKSRLWKGFSAQTTPHNPEGEAVVNDSPVGCQSRRTNRSIFTAVKMQDREVQIPPPQPQNG